jgi:predicted RecA/RadA family phage recombinase
MPATYYEKRISDLEKEILRLKDMFSGKGKVVNFGKEFHVDRTIKVSEIINKADRFIDGKNILISSVEDGNVSLISDGTISIGSESESVKINGNDIESDVIDCSSVNSNVIITDAVVLNPDGVTNPELPGTLRYNATQQTLDFYLGNGVTVNLPEEFMFAVKNKTGAKALNGKLVYISGSNGNKATFGYATNATCASASRTIAMLTQDIENNGVGKATHIGLVRDLNTHGIAEGTEVWLGINGDITVTRPSSGTARVRVGIVIREHPTLGEILITISADKYMFGDRDNGNYSIFEDSGFLKFVGNAKPWVDIDFPVIIRNTGLGIPSLATFQGNLKAPQWAVNDYYDADDQEMIHPWEEGSLVYWHAHIWTSVQDATNRYINLELEFTAANYYKVGVSNTAAITNIIQNSGDFLIPANTPALTHFLVPIYIWTPTSFLIGSHVKARLKRIASSGAAPSANFFCSKFQMHARIDGGGSREIGIK